MKCCLRTRLKFQISQINHLTDPCTPASMEQASCKMMRNCRRCKRGSCMRGERRGVPGGIHIAANVEPFSIHANCPSPCIRNNSPTSARSPSFATRLSNTFIMFAFYLDVKVLNWEGSIENLYIKIEKMRKIKLNNESRFHLGNEKIRQRLNRILYKRRHLLLKWDQQCKML
ncbi:hypothetical protein T06_8684 [Trichinella sp. T6]|nr:hypothetical protein T06_8684 [Trichinella sp. T6]